MARITNIFEIRPVIDKLLDTESHQSEVRWSLSYTPEDSG
jgi:hypothetical protein